MWAREQSVRYLQQYIHARNETPWVVRMCPGIESFALLA